MKLPKKIKVGPVWYSVLEVPGKMIGHAYAESYSKINDIKMNEDLGHQQKALTIIHELMHIALHVSGARVAANLKMNEQEEVMIRVLESTLLSIIVENPDLIKYLVEGSKKNV